MIANSVIQWSVLLSSASLIWLVQDDQPKVENAPEQVVAAEQQELGCAVDDIKTIDQVRVDEPAEVPANRGLSGLWALEWDDAIDGKLSDETKSCDVRLRVIDHELIGYFDGPVLGEQRDAVFLGTVYGSDMPLIVFVQREASYTCSYHIYWKPGEAGPPTGTWHDSRGASGEFSLLKYQ